MARIKYSERKEIGNLYGKLRVISHVGFNKYGHDLWECSCDCGITGIIIPGVSLRSGNSLTCGCGRKKHGHRLASGSSPTYSAWTSMLRRCDSPHNDSYMRYGGRGIEVCARWLESFENFLEDMGEKPHGKTLDRIDVNGNYDPGNCRWATIKEQNRNKTSNVYLTLNGVTKTIAEWAEISGVKYTTFHERLKRGWTLEEALLPSKVG